jgi:amidase
MARSASDLTLGLDVLAGPDPWTDGIGFRLALPPARHNALKAFKVMLIDTHPLFPTATSVRAALETLADGLRHEGCQVERMSSLLPDIAAISHLHATLMGAALSETLSDAVHSRMTAAARPTDAAPGSLAASRFSGMTMNHRAWLGARRQRSALAQQWREFFSAFDVLLCPVMPTPAFPHDHSSTFLQNPAANPGTRRLAVDGREACYDDQMVWSSIAVLFGLPATVAPIGLSATGLPIGVQIVAGYLEDRTSIEFARLIEQTFGGFRKPGGL